MYNVCACVISISLDVKPCQAAEGNILEAINLALNCELVVERRGGGWWGGQWRDRERREKAVEMVGQLMDGREVVREEEMK